MCALSLGAFSITANAESEKSYDTKIQYQWVEGSTIRITRSLNVNSAPPTPSGILLEDANFNNNSFINLQFTFNLPNNEIIVADGKTFNISVGSFSSAWKADGVNSTFVYFQKFDDMRVSLVDTAGRYHYLTDVVYSFSGNTTLGNFSVPDTVAPADIVKVIFTLKYTPTIRTGVTGVHNLNFAYNDIHGMFPTLNVDVASDEENLLGGILGKITQLFSKTEENTENVKKGFKDVVDNVKNGFANVVKGITELPQKLWNLIAEGLKNLFVPDEDYMTTYSDEWDELLSSRFGAIYQSGQIIQEFGDALDYADQTDTIHMPEVSLHDVGVPFTFGGYDVQIVPSGFRKYTGGLKGIISIVCTFMFVNGLRKRYDEVMGVKT